MHSRGRDCALNYGDFPARLRFRRNGDRSNLVTDIKSEQHNIYEQTKGVESSYLSL
jgi:hypothetical protein